MHFFTNQLSPNLFYIYSVIGYLIVANLVFWNEYMPTYYELIDDDNALAASYVQSWASRLMVFVLTAFLFRVVSAYWIGTRTKGKWKKLLACDV